VNTIDSQTTIARRRYTRTLSRIFGIADQPGATGELTDNLIVGNEYTGTTPGIESIGIDIFGGCTDIGGGPLDTNVHVAGNHIANNGARHPALAPGTQITGTGDSPSPEEHQCCREPRSRGRNRTPSIWRRRC
jgi:hypothetical protein